MYCDVAVFVYSKIVNTQHCNLSIRVIFGAPHLANSGLMAGVTQNFGESRVSKKLVFARTILLSALFY